MSEREYQQRIIESSNELVFCDWDRGRGKTYAIAKDIANKIDATRKTIVIVTNGRHMQTIIGDYLRLELSRYEVILKERDTLSIGVYIADRIKTQEKRYNELVKIVIVRNNETDSIRGMKFDYAYCDEYIPSSNDINIFKNSLVKQIYVLGTFNIEYISDKEIDINENDWIEQEIKKLMKEFSRIPNDGNTTKRRESVLGMIRELKNINGKDIEQTLLNKAIRENNVDDICNIEINTGVAMGLSIAIYNGNLTYEQALELLDSYCPDNKMVRAIFIDKHNRSIR